MSLFESGAKVGKKSSLYFAKDTTAHIEAAIRDAKKECDTVLVIAFAPVDLPEDLADVKVANYKDDGKAFITAVNKALIAEQGKFAIVVNGLAEMHGVLMEGILPETKQAAEFQEYGAVQMQMMRALRHWLSASCAFFATVDVIDKVNPTTKQVVTRLNVTPGIANSLRTLFPLKVFFAIVSVRTPGKPPTSVVTRQDDAGLAMQFIANKEESV